MCNVHSCHTGRLGRMVRMYGKETERRQINLYYSLTKRGEYDKIGTWHESEISAKATSGDASVLLMRISARRTIIYNKKFFAGGLPR